MYNVNGITVVFVSAAIVFLASASASAFVVPVPNSRSSARNIPHCQRQRQIQSTSSLQLVAGSSSPMEKEGEKAKRKEPNNGDDSSSSNSSDWIPTDGGFLPNFRSRLLHRAPPDEVANPIHEVVDIHSYKEMVVEEHDRIVCVRFYAPWCRACRAVEGKFRKLARDNRNVKFVEVPLTKENAYLHKGLDVPSLPYAHVYYPNAGLVEERSINKKYFGTFQRALETYVDGECEVWYDETGNVDGSSMAGHPVDV